MFRAALPVLAMLAVALGWGLVRGTADRRPPPIGAAARDSVPGMIFLAGGRVSIGTTQAELDTLLAGQPPHIASFFRYETPRHDVDLEPYFIGTYEVSNAQYAHFLAAEAARGARIAPPRHWTGLRPPAGEEDHPVRFVSFNDAERFAFWAGLRLTTESEWEHAARGSERRPYPWGSAWAAAAQRANWGERVLDGRAAVTTLPVASAGEEAPARDGRSWCGCHHMVGNVCEWTASWFDAYPGSAHKHAYMGRWVKVIRGGGASDAHPLVLRCACRNFVGGGREAPPYPDNAFQWAGFRVASSLRPGANAVGAVLRRAGAERKVDEQQFDAARFLAAVTRDWVSPGDEPPHHVYVRGRAHALVVLPVRRVALDPWRSRRFEGALTEAHLATWSRRNPLVIGVVHTTVALRDVQVPQEGLMVPARRGPPRRAAMPRTEPGTCVAGTYLLAWSWERLALLDTQAAFVCFLRAHVPPLVIDPPAAARDAPDTSDRLVLDVPADRATFRFRVATRVGDRDRPEYCRVTLRLPFASGALAAAGSWLQERR